WSEGAYWLVGSVTAVLFFVSVLLHELAHSVVAMRHDIPVKHITLFLFGGVANIKREAENPSIELVIAAAGPAASVLLSAFFGIVWFLSRGFSEHLAALSFYLGTINAMLALFNLIPGFPMDGGRILRATLWQLTSNFCQATRVASITGQIVACSFMLGGVLLAVMGNWLNGVWLIFIGWFLHNAVESSYQQSIAQNLLRGVSVAEMMAKDCPVVDENVSLKDLVDDYVLRYAAIAFPVVHNALLVGIVTLDNVKEVPREKWPGTVVADVMTGIEKLKTFHPWEDASRALQQMNERDSLQAPVVEGGQVVGLLSKTRILQFMKLREELGAH
ncbi:MAG: site-2 protease family protein, partial [Chloroflexi bacterium]|nr:site-2 protease family protein [Chloroflexota bacterium]